MPRPTTKEDLIKAANDQSAALENGFRNETSHCFRMRCRAVFLKGKGLSSVEAGQQTEMSFVSVNA